MNLILHHRFPTFGKFPATRTIAGSNFGNNLSTSLFYYYYCCCYYYYSQEARPGFVVGRETMMLTARRSFSKILSPMWITSSCGTLIT